MPPFLPPSGLPTLSAAVPTRLIKLCRTAEVPHGRPITVIHAGLPRIVVFRVDEKFFAAVDRCSHGNARLSDGAQSQGLIYCPLHGGAFDIATGRAVAPPCRTPIKTLPVVVQAECIYVETVATSPGSII
ncbi:non-heme iron oxygenase ferredoxin subunit [Pigmentiphaga sp.]|uniref:non-heme iron oxygenase ferredoxin subunit n=1 Tax=Pigmentiphaga sp. TaxID=1977564 RepID=UPI0039B98FAF